MIYINNEFVDIIFYNKNDELHREDGPAIIERNYQVWYKNDKRHRIDGPAYIRGNYEEHWIDGIRQ